MFFNLIYPHNGHERFWVAATSPSRQNQPLNTIKEGTTPIELQHVASNQKKAEIPDLNLSPPLDDERSSESVRKPVQKGGKKSKYALKAEILIKEGKYKEFRQAENLRKQKFFHRLTPEEKLERSRKDQKTLFGRIAQVSLSKTMENIFITLYRLLFL